MIWFFSALLSLITTVAEKFITVFARRLPVILAAIALIVTVTVTYLATMHAVVVSIGQTIPGVVSDVWGWVMPGNAVQCILAVLTARIIRWSYTKYEKMIVFKAKALTP